MQNQAKFSLLFFSDEPKKGRNNIFCQKITIDNLTKSNSRLKLCLHAPFLFIPNKHRIKKLIIFYH